MQEEHVRGHGGDVEPPSQEGRTELVHVRVLVKAPVDAAKNGTKPLHDIRTGEVSLLGITPQPRLRPSYRWELERCGCLE